NACSSLCPVVEQAVQCPRECEEGCQCDAGYLHDGHACVSTGHCGCSQDGRRFKASESKILQNCTMKCTCGPPLVCEDYSCPAQHSCVVSDGTMGCSKAVESPDPCEERCDESEKCSLSNGVPVCETPQGVCWAWGHPHYHTFDGLDYDFEGSCTYLLAASRGAACGLTPFSVSEKSDRYGSTSTRVVTVQAYGFIIKLSSEKGRVWVNGLVEYLPVSLLRGKIQVSHREGKVLLKTDFGMQVVFDWSSTVAVTLNPRYNGKVYGLCGNFNGDPLDEHTVATHGSLPIQSVVDLAQAYRLFDGDHRCCTDCKQTADKLILAPDPVPNNTSSYRRLCAVLMDQKGHFAHCHGKVNPDSFYQSCVVDLMHNGESKVAVDQAMKSYSLVCEQSNDDYNSGVISDAHCPANSHYKTCGSACPPSCEFNVAYCNKICVQGCFCNSGFVKSPEGCVRPKQCGCTDSIGKYHSLNTTFWTPDNCGQLCVCGPATREIHCKPTECPRGQFCKRLGRIRVDGLHKPLPYSHQTGRVKAYHTPSSLVIHIDMGLQLVLYKMGTIMVVLPSTCGSSVSGLCGNANANPHDDQLMPNGEHAQNTLEFAHSWRSGGAEACRSSCASKLKHCPAEEQRLFEGRDFCGVLLNELGPFEDCASVLSPKNYFHSCVADSCSYGGHSSGLCSSIASYTAACQAAQLPIRQWRSDTFCGMLCPKNSHYELCGPRCPVVCAGLSSPANCSGGCEEGCQCDPGYVLSDGRCVLVSDCGCMHDGQYYPAGYFYPGHSCQKCHCRRGEVTCNPTPCSPLESCLVKDGVAKCKPLEYGVCQVLAGFGYVTFDGLALPHHGACTYVVSDLSSKAIHDYTLLLSFKERNGIIHKMSRVVFLWHSLELSIDPETPWKMQVNKEELSLPFDMGKIKAYQDGSSLTITTMSGVRIQLSSTQYLSLSVPHGYEATASGLCGNFNGDQSDDLELRNNHLTKSIAEFLYSWAVVAPGQPCYKNCGTACDGCSVSPEAMMACDVLLARSVVFNHCWNSGVEPHVYRDVCIRAVCAGAGHMEATCLALEAYAAACQAKGITLGSSAVGCSEGCQCLNGNVFDREECVPHSRCGCVLHDRYIKMDEQLYTEDCTQRCWCHPVGRALCEKAACSPGQQCALRNGSWGCHEQPVVCELRSSLQVSTLSGQQLSLEPQFSYSLVSLCDEASEQWFSLISYHGPCHGSSSRVVTVLQILLKGSSVAIQEGTVKVNGHFVSLPYMLPSGVSLSPGVTQDKSEVTVILRRDAGMESELEMEIGVTMVTVKLPLWYSDKLCGLCGNHNDLHSHKSVKSWVLPDFPGCGFSG
ncbi:IgGFc-binding protein-like, partial [Centroberyx gerrardi]